METAGFVFKGKLLDRVLISSDFGIPGNHVTSNPNFERMEVSRSVFLSGVKSGEPSHFGLVALRLIVPWCD